MTSVVAAAEVLLGRRTAISEAAFRELYDNTARPLKSYLSRITGNPTLADDLLQETYFRYLRACPDLDSSQLKSYLYRIATNLARDHFRRRKFEEGQTTHDAAADTPPDPVFDIEKALGEIQPKERELIWLAYVEGASHREIAAITGLKETSVRPLLFRIRHKLANILREKGLER